MIGATAVEFAWWAALWFSGYAPSPFVLTYLGLAFAAMTCVAAVRMVAVRPAAQPNGATVIPATALIGLGASLFLPLKYAIPKLIPFWLDPPLASAERTVFGTDPWLVADRLLGWAAVPLDRLYGLWLPAQAALLFTVLLLPPSRNKSLALVAYVLAWLILGVFAALLLSSAGPLFYDRIFGGSWFAALRPTLEHRGAWVALAESDRMWRSLASRQPDLVAGISAVPSIHVAISFWIYLTVRRMAPGAAIYALIYAALVWIGSVQLGWHYASDGLVGVAGMLAVWSLSGRLVDRLTK